MVKKWLKKNITGYEVHRSTEGNEIVLIPSSSADKAIRYIERYYPQIRLEWRANYTWLAIFL